MGDLFGSFFGGGSGAGGGGSRNSHAGGGARQGGGSGGAHQRQGGGAGRAGVVDVQVSLNDLFKGTTKTVKVAGRKVRARRGALLVSENATT